MPPPLRSLISRLARDAAVAVELVRSGADPFSVLLFPIRRRSGHVTEIRLRSGVTLRAPQREPLPFLFKEIWCERCYGALPTAEGAPVVVDIGAHVGVYAVWAATQPCRPRVIAVEPAPRALDFLRENVRINRLDNVTIVAAACGSGEGERPLHLARAEMMNSLYERDGTDGPSVAVPLVSLDRILRDSGVDRCDLLKVDCEGAEFEILLEGCTDETLRRVGAITMEFHRWAGPERIGQLTGRLRRLGFDVEVTDGSDAQHGYLRAARQPRPVEVRLGETARRLRPA